MLRIICQNSFHPITIDIRPPINPTRVTIIFRSFSIPELSPGMPDKTTTNRFSDYDKFPLPYETALKVSSDGEQLIL